MNRLTKKIRKPNRRYPSTAKTNNNNEPINFDVLNKLQECNDTYSETLTSSLANMQENIQECRFYEIVSNQVIQRLIDCIAHTNPQIVINALSAFQNLFRISSFFGQEKSIMEEVSFKQGLIIGLEKLQSQIVQAIQLIEKDDSVQHVCSSMLYLLTEIFESCSTATLRQLEQSSFFNGTLNLIVQILQKVVNEEVFLALVNYLQVLSESVPSVNQLITTSQSLFGRIFQLFEGDFNSTTILQQSVYTYKLKVCSLLIPIVLNTILSFNKSKQKDTNMIQKFTQTVGQLITNGLSVKIFNEVQNLKNIIGGLLQQDHKKPEQQINELEQEEQVESCLNESIDSDKRVRNSLNIWLNTTDAIIEQLRFIARLYEGTDYEDEMDSEIDEEMEIDHQQPQNKLKIPSIDKNIVDILPAFFKAEFQNEIITIVFNNFYSLTPLLQEEEFLIKIQGYQIGNYIKEASLMIINASLAVIQNILNIVDLNNIDINIQQQISKGVQDQIYCLLTKTSIIYDNNSDFQDLLSSYLKCLSLLLSKPNSKLIQQVPEEALIKISQLLLCHKGVGGDNCLHLIELLKLRYNSTIKNSYQSIEAVTISLLPALSQNDALLCAQALDCLFDIYTEEDYNEILLKMNIIPQLQSGHDYMKKEFSKLKKELRLEDFNFVKLTLVNLKNFIQYKRKIMKI